MHILFFYKRVFEIRACAALLKSLGLDGDNFSEDCTAHDLATQLYQESKFKLQNIILK